MKRLWNIVAVLAIANVLGVLGFAAWLKATDRLSMERLAKVREMLTPTIAQDAAKAEEMKLAAEAGEKKAQEEARLSGPPESAVERIDRQRQMDDATMQTVLRARREIEDLRRQLLEDREKLDKEWASLGADQAKWQANRQEQAKELSGKQFKQALTTLESQKPKDAQQLLKLLHNEQAVPVRGATPAAGGLPGQAGASQAVAYLAALQDRTRGKILAEWVKDDPKVAAELLEHLRLRGLGEGGSVGAADSAPSTLAAGGK
ncbi:MAG: hypothetical protein ACKVS8_05455 [Phycisphaerales bacterium]